LTNIHLEWVGSAVTSNETEGLTLYMYLFG